MQIHVCEVVGNRTRHGEFELTVDFLTRQDINTIKRNVKDSQVMWHQDATSVSLVVAELQQEMIVQSHPCVQSPRAHWIASITLNCFIIESNTMIQLFVQSICFPTPASLAGKQNSEIINMSKRTIQQYYHSMLFQYTPQL